MNYSLDEIALIPSIVSSVEHRSQVCCLTDDDKLPIFVSPMTSIVNKDNYPLYKNSDFIPIMPIWYYNKEERLELLNRGEWVALTLDEFIHYFCGCNIEENVEPFHYHVLIDCANGHMNKLLTAVEDAKQEFGYKLVVMAGNLANPDTYRYYCDCGIDYCRLGIGGNIVCETGSLTGFHTSLPWLLTKIKEIKSTFGCTCKVVADGGVNSIAKIIKCLALGADYVMCGYMFATVGPGQYNKYYGQASPFGQKDRFGDSREIKYVEGSLTHVPVKYLTLDELAKDIRCSLESAMSYANAFTLDDFIGKVKWDIQSIAEYKSFNA